NTGFGDNGRHIPGRGHIKGGIGYSYTHWGYLRTQEGCYLVRAALLDWNSISIWKREVNRGAGSGDIQGDAVCVCQHPKTIGADLIGDVAIGGDAIGADEDGGDSPSSHKVGGHIIGNEGKRYSGTLQLPGGEPGSLEHRTSLVDEYLDTPPG